MTSTDGVVQKWKCSPVPIYYDVLSNFIADRIHVTFQIPFQLPLLQTVART